MIAGVFTNTIPLGTALTTVLMLAFAAYFAWKNKALEASQKSADEANEQASQWRENYLAERQLTEDAQRRSAEAIAVIEEKYQEQRALKHAALTENATLRMATDLTSVMRAIADINARLVAVEERIIQRFEAFAKGQEAQVKALEAIVKRVNGG